MAGKKKQREFAWVKSFFQKGGHPHLLQTYQNSIQIALQRELEAWADDVCGPKGKPKGSLCRNGYYTRGLLTVAGWVELKVPRFRGGKAPPPPIFKPYQRHAVEIILLWITLFSLNLSCRNISKAVATVFGASVSFQTVYRWVKKAHRFTENAVAGDICEDYCAVILDGVYGRVRDSETPGKGVLLASLGVTDDGGGSPVPIVRVTRLPSSVQVDYSKANSRQIHLIEKKVADSEYLIIIMIQSKIYLAFLKGNSEKGNDMKHFVITLTILLAGFCSAQAYLEVHGYGVEARVDTGIGYFGVGTNPIPRALTWDFIPVTSGIGNSHFILRVDGETYGLALEGSEGSFSPPLTSTLEPYHDAGFPILIPASNTIHNKWNLPEGITVNQYFTPDSLDSLGLIKVRYVLRNDDVFNHTIALEHKWDVYVNGVDDAVFALPASGVINTNSVFTPADMPPYILIPDDPASPTLVGVMVVDAFDATCPDFFAYGEEVDIISYNFSIDSTFAGSPYSLSAALIRWDDEIVVSGGERELITYYGIGYDYASITETPSRPSDFAISVYPNPFNSAVTISFDVVGASLAPARVEIYDLAGRKVAELPSPSVPLPEGEGGDPFSHWEKVAEGRMRAFIWRPDPSLPSGVYLVRARFGSAQQNNGGCETSRRITYLK